MRNEREGPPKEGESYRPTSALRGHLDYADLVERMGQGITVEWPDPVTYRRHPDLPASADERTPRRPRG